MNTDRMLANAEAMHENPHEDAINDGVAAFLNARRDWFAKHRDALISLANDYDLTTMDAWREETGYSDELDDPYEQAEIPPDPFADIRHAIRDLAPEVAKR